MIKQIFKIAIIGILLVTSSLTTSCFKKTFIKPSQQEIDEYIANNPNLSELDKACIYDGRFEVGMRQETVKFLLGPPKQVEIIQQPWAQQEKWIYKAGNHKIFFIEDEGVVGIEEL
jgi:hypothetical protein